MVKRIRLTAPTLVTAVVEAVVGLYGLFTTPIDWGVKV